MSRKQQLLKRHRRTKRLILLAGFVVLVGVGILLAWWLAMALAVLAWVAHEAWFADHLFYSPADDYDYAFDAAADRLETRWQGGLLSLAGDAALADDDTLILQVRLRAGWLGRFLDPGVEMVGAQHGDCQVFERGVKGLRYLNLSGFAAPLRDGPLRLRGRFCRVEGEPELLRFSHPDFTRKRVMVIAPHADDAELAAYGLYSQVERPWIVTLTAGEIEAEHYQRMGMAPALAAQTKGRLRAWDSIAVPRWAGVPQEHCVQLGYFCLQLPAMRAAPDQPAPSREAEMNDIRPFRTLNPQRLAGDVDGAPTWRNLLADLAALIEQARPEVIVLPDATFDPHPDHICSRAAVLEALLTTTWQPGYLLGYANHLHDNDRWPMGEQGVGVALPPLLQRQEGLRPWSLALDAARQRDKAMALGMMHDLQPPPPFKRQVRRLIQRVLAGRRQWRYGDNDFFRKAVRRHELFWVLPGQGAEPQPTIANDSNAMLER